MKIFTWKNEEYVVLFVYLLINENLYLKSCLSGSKIGINAFILGGGGLDKVGGLIPGVTQILRKRWAYLRGGGGG